MPKPSKKIITAPWGKIRLSVATSAVPLRGDDNGPVTISVEVWRRGSYCVDEHLMCADELAALGSDEVRQWLAEQGIEVQ